MSQQNDNVKRNNQNNGNSSKKKKKRPIFRLSSVFFIFFIVYICSFLAYMVQVNASGDIPVKDGVGDSIISENENPIDEENSQTEETTTTADTQSVDINVDTPVTNPVPESSTVSEDYLDTCLFVGDSISTGYEQYFLLNPENVLAQSGLVPLYLPEKTIEYQGEEVLAIDGVVKSGFKNIYIMLGSNGVGWLSDNDMVNPYRDFINQIKERVEGANIYIVSVPPVTSKKEDTSEYATIEDGLVLNSTIDDLNALFLDLANELNVHYLDINSYLKDDTGKLPYDSSVDGMHFDLKTYQKILDYVCCHIAN